MKSIGVIAALLLSTTAASAQGRLGEDFERKLHRITDDIYAYEGPLELPGEDEIVRTNSLVVVTGDGVVIVDGQDNVEEAEHLLAAIREVTDERIRYVINASPHGDHVNGNAAFGDAVLVAQERAKEVMAEADPMPPLPTITYDDRMTLHVGSKTIELYYFGPAHTPGDTIVYVPEDRVAFLSEVYFNGVFTSLVDGFAVSHMSVIDEIQKLDAEWFIPGHGIIDGQSAEDLRAGLDRYEANVKAVHDAVLKHVQAGHTLEQTLEAIDDDLGDFVDIPFYEFLKPRSVEATYRALKGE